MTGINIPDMVTLVKSHGLIPVPIDVDPETMYPDSPEIVKGLITEKVF